MVKLGKLFGKDKTDTTKTEQVSYFTITSGIKVIGENAYANRMNELKQQTGKVPSELSDQVNKEFGTSGVSFWPDKGIYMISAKCPDEAKENITDKKSEYEKAFGIEINLKKLEIK